MPAKFLYNLTKNLTAHLQHKLCAVLPLYFSTLAEIKQGRRKKLLVCTAISRKMQRWYVLTFTVKDDIINKKVLQEETWDPY